MRTISPRSRLKQQPQQQQRHERQLLSKLLSLLLSNFGVVKVNLDLPFLRSLDKLKYLPISEQHIN